MISDCSFVKLENFEGKDQIHDCPINPNTGQEDRHWLGSNAVFTENAHELVPSFALKIKTQKSSISCLCPIRGIT